MSRTKPFGISMKAGFDKNTTNYANEGRWINGDKVRFRNLKAEKLGGWVAEQTGDGDLDGVTRDLLTWVDLSSNKIAAFGTHKRLQLFVFGNYSDITPIIKTVNPPVTMNTVNTSSIVTIEITTHQASVGDTIIISSSSGLIGTTIDPNGEFEITEVVDNDNFKVDMITVATSTGANGSWTGDIDFLLPIGLESNTPFFGYGAGTYGTGTYGTPRAAGVTSNMRQWSLTTFGEDLLACPRGGEIYRWDASGGVNIRAATLTNSPAENLYVLTSDQARHVISFGCTDEAGNFDPLLIRWSSSEDFNDWIITDTNTAGNKRLGKGVEIIGAVQTKREILIFTDNTVYSMRYVGGNTVFAFDELADNTGAISPHSHVDVEGRVYWMGKKGYYIYDGATRNIKCDLQKALFDNTSDESVNPDQQFKVYCGSNTEFQEIWWFYPSKNSDENDRYVIFNYAQGIWYDGTIVRTAWEDTNVFDRPYGTDTTTLFIQEQGKDDDGSVMTSFVESGDLEIGEGDDLTFINRFIPDFKLTGPIDLNLSWRKYPQDEFTEKGPYTIQPDTSKVDLRIRGRQIRVKYTSASTGADWEAGNIKVLGKPDGNR